MELQGLSRRALLLGAAGTTAGLIGNGAARSEEKQPAASLLDKAIAANRFRYCLNMSTIRGQELTAAQEVDIAAKAGYDAIEPWLGKLNEYVKSGGSLKDLRKRIEDGGLTVESAIGFARWIVDDEAERQKGLEEARRDMDLLAQIGGKRIAAPPAGAPNDRSIDLWKSAERYRQLLEIGDQIGVIPQVEMWGFSRSIGTISAAVFVAIEAKHPKACFLGDVYHAYKGDGAFHGLRLLGPHALQVFHMNDYPADPPRETIRDEHRVYPGDGIAPQSDILNGFRDVGAYPVLSLELFNRDYWKQDALTVARTGLQKMKDAVAKAEAKPA